MTRDYAAEMRRVLDAETADGPYVPRVVAEHVVEKLKVVDPDLLQGWLEAGAADFLYRLIVERDRSRRAQITQTAKRAAFAEAATAAGTGDHSGLTQFLDMRYPVGGVHKRLADLTAADLSTVADQYERRAAENRFVAVFLRVLAKNVGDDTVGQRYTEAQLARLWTTRADYTD